MRKRGAWKAGWSAGAWLVAMAAVPVCHAQERQAQDAIAEAPIVVTGSRLVRQPDQSVIPVHAVRAEDLPGEAQPSIGDRITRLPQLRASFTQANSTRFIGTAGQNFLDLRGLNTDRTLVLVDGRRQVSSTPGSFRWDTSALPVDLVERVDVMTGGNSAIYGSDAVAGVVNLVLRQRFDGVQLRALSGISGRGDAATRTVSGLAGTSFAGGRGSVMIAADHARQAALGIPARQQGRDRRQFQTVQNTGPQLNPAIGPLRLAGEPAAGDGIADSAFIGNLRRVATSLGGTITATCPTTAAPGESATAFAARRTAACSDIANPLSTSPLGQFGAAYAFLPDGSLVPNGCTTDFRATGSGNCIGGLGSTLRETGQLRPRLVRTSAALVASFEVAPAFEPFVEGFYARTRVMQESAPSFGALTYSIGNPFLTPQARAQVAAMLPPGTTTFQVDRQNIDFGVRGEDHRRETWRVTGGARGDLGGGWRYELAAHYGRFTSFYETRGNYVTARLANAINAVVAPASYAGSSFLLNGAGQRVVCAINADASSANDDPACFPADLFGQGRLAPQSLAWFAHTSSRRQRNDQLIVAGHVAGDTRAFLTLPGGPVGVVLGAEYRRERQRSAFDALTASGATFLNAVLPFAPPAYAFRDAFAELRAPVLADAPFAHELTLEAAARLSDHSQGGTGTVLAWNAGAAWAPVEGLRFRASLQRAIRAPTPGDLFTTTAQTFNTTFADPCGQPNIAANPNRAANCAAAGVPTTQTFRVGGITTTEPFTNRSTFPLAAGVGGNPDLREERSRSLTLGVVASPAFAPGLTLAVDWHRIDLRDAITTLGPQAVLERCYDDPGGIDNPWCKAVNRLANGTLAGQRLVTHAGAPVLINNPGLSSISQPFNFARLRTNGIDADLSWRHQWAEDRAITFRAVASHLIRRDVYADITNPATRNRIKSELGDPAWRLRLSTRLDLDRWSLAHDAHYIGRQILSGFEYETFFPLDGRPALNPDATPSPWYPARWQHDLRIGFTPSDRLAIHVAVENVLDAKPPLDLLGIENGSLLDAVGRYVSMSVKVSF